MIAVNAIIEGRQQGDKIKYKELPVLTKENISDIVKEYDSYIGKLIELFGEEGYKSRAVDQALWAYGHHFKQK